jgi:hypothetical protein
MMEQAEARQPASTNSPSLSASLIIGFGFSQMTETTKPSWGLGAPMTVTARAKVEGMVITVVLADESSRLRWPFKFCAKPTDTETWLCGIGQPLF